MLPDQCIFISFQIDQEYFNVLEIIARERFKLVYVMNIFIYFFSFASFFDLISSFIHFCSAWSLLCWSFLCIDCCQMFLFRNNSMIAHSICKLYLFLCMFLYLKSPFFLLSSLSLSLFLTCNLFLGIFSLPN